MMSELSKLKVSSDMNRIIVVVLLLLVMSHSFPQRNTTPLLRARRHIKQGLRDFRDTVNVSRKQTRVRCFILTTHAQCTNCDSTISSHHYYRMRIYVARGLSKIVCFALDDKGRILCQKSINQFSCTNGMSTITRKKGLFISLKRSVQGGIWRLKQWGKYRVRRYKYWKGSD